MKRSTTKVLLLALLILAVPTHAAAHAATLRGRCVSITDGDTIKVLVDKQVLRIRLNGVDCPEKKQAFGTQATKYTSAWALGRSVTVYSTGTDRYKRTLGWVFIGKRCLNRDLVTAGCAWWYEKYAPDNTTLRDLEAKARAEKRGLWSDPHAVAPWKWRRSH